MYTESKEDVHARQCIMLEDAYQITEIMHYAASAGDRDRAKKIFNQAEALEAPTNEDHELKEDLLDKLCYIWLAYARDRARKK